MVIVLKNCHNNNNITSFRSATQNLSCTAFSNFWSLANVLLYFHSIWRYKHKGVGMLDLVYCFQTTINSWYTCNATKSLSISSSRSQTTSLKLVNFSLIFLFFDSMFVFDNPCWTFFTHFLKITQSNHSMLDSTSWSNGHMLPLFISIDTWTRKVRSVLSDTKNATSV